MKYALRYHYDVGEGPLVRIECLHGQLIRAPASLEEATRFDTPAAAIRAAQDAARTEYGPANLDLVVVEETPGETVREVVPLEGTVDFGSIQMYALESLIRPGHYLGGVGISFVTDPTQAQVRDTPGYIFENASRRGFHLGRFRLVGIRETSTEPTLTVRPLSTYALATD